ncbi:MAG: OmpA family protein [Ginsengibacter sp.]
MKCIKTFFTLSFCLCISISSHAQIEALQKEGIISFGASVSDYNFVKYANDSSLKYAVSNKDLVKSGKASLGIQLSYWRHLKPHIDISGNLGVDFSNFPAFFIKGDSIGQARVSVHVSGLAHFMAFNSDAKVNPFLTAGLGAGLFGSHFAFFAPVGAGLAFHFNTGGVVTLQLQWRKALTSGITSDFMFYSIGIAQGISGRIIKKYESHKDEIVKNAITIVKKIDVRSARPKKSSKEKGSATTANKKIDKVSPPNDTDGDGVPDKDDKCPGMKGSVANQGCPLPVVEGAEILNMSPDSATYSIHFDFDRSELQTGDFSVLNRIVEILRSDRSLNINITGHADSLGTDQKNMQVSADRAQVTLDYFRSYNVSASRIKSSYYGATRPIDKAQQWRNRRVEITLVKK